jgi:hypothetical protein
MSDAISAEELRRRVGVPLSDQEVDALLNWYATLREGMQKFPIDELRAVEPPLRSTPGPIA